MKTQIKDNNLVITIPIPSNMPLSKKGKSKIVYQSMFAKADVEIEGLPVFVTMSVIAKLPKAPKLEDYED